jgi:enoyl-CoA hydratase/carnithine racemase
MPFEVSRRDGVLHLSLDTPNCAVNIFDRRTAEQLRELLPQVSPRDTRAVVFRSAKVESFINGVGLLMIQSARSRETIRVGGDFFRTAYHTVRDCPVPTIAAVRGNCWGCGLEFLLNCHYRIAADTCSTNFFMTEVVNYLLFPTFDGVHNLPVQLGFENALNLLLWGERWSSQRAAQEGLINEVANHRHFDESVNRFVSRVLAGGVSRCIPERKRLAWTEDCETLRRVTEERIRALPPDYQQVYLDCLDQMVRAARKDELGEEDHALARSWEADSILSRAGKSAHSFFFIQQIASQFPPPGATPPGLARISFTGEGRSFAAFAEDLESRLVEGVTVTPPRMRPDAGGFDRVIVDLQGPRGEESCAFLEVDVRTGDRRDHSDPKPLRLYSPIRAVNPRFFELAATDHAVAQLVEVASYLRRAGFTIVPTRTGGRFGTDRLIRSFLGPLAAYVIRGGDVRDVNFTLREFGFIRRPHALLENLGIESAADWLRPVLIDQESAAALPGVLELLRGKEFAGGRWDQDLLDALAISWTAFARTGIRKGVFSHPTLIDVTAREVIDFPLMQKSLCNWLSQSRVAEALGCVDRYRDLVGEEDLVVASDYLAGGRGFYA